MTSTLLPSSRYVDTYDWHSWCQRLRKIRPFGKVNAPGSRFIFRAVPRNPRKSSPSRWELRDGVHGVRDRELLLLYAEALEAAYSWFIQQGRPAPAVDRNGKIPVYVFAVDDDQMDCRSAMMDELIFFKAFNQIDRLEPAIALPSRSGEPLADAERDQAQATAVHELSHYFNAKFLPYRRLGPQRLEERPLGLFTVEEARAWKRSWLWLDEGLALLAEAEVLPRVRDWLAFTLEPIDRPDRAVDCLEDSYYGMLFARYLHRLMQRRGDSGFWNRVWQMSQTVWDPRGSVRHAAVTALADALRQPPHELVFCSATEPDVFASGFCFDSYFLHEAGSPGHEPEVFDRFAGRAVTRSWTMLSGQPVHPSMADTYPLSGLGCRYFRFFPNGPASRLTVTITAPAGHQLKAELACSTVKTGHLVKGSRTVGHSVTKTGQDVLSCELADFSSQSADHAVLVVTNCAIGSGDPNDPTPSGYSQNIAFKVEAVCR